jgi:hypothetical protein
MKQSGVLLVCLSMRVARPRAWSWFSCHRSRARLEAAGARAAMNVTTTGLEWDHESGFMIRLAMQTVD